MRVFEEKTEKQIVNSNNFSNLAIDIILQNFLMNISSKKEIEVRKFINTFIEDTIASGDKYIFALKENK